MRDSNIVSDSSAYSRARLRIAELGPTTPAIRPSWLYKNNSWHECLDHLQRVSIIARFAGLKSSALIQSPSFMAADISPTVRMGLNNVSGRARILG